MKKAVKFLTKYIVMGCVIGAVVGFGAPFTTGYLIPKIQESRAVADETETQDDNSSEIINVENTVSLSENIC